MPRQNAINPTGQRITAWSYSRWDTYVECARKAYYKYIAKLPDPPSPAAERGTALHLNAQHFVEGVTTQLDPAWSRHAAFLRAVRKKQPSCELELAFTSDWSVTGWFSRDTWCRVKIDLSYVEDDTLVLEDYKTGKKYDSHEKQLSLYAVAGLLTEPDAARVVARNRYVDMPTSEVTEHIYTRRELPVLQKDWERKTKAMLRDTRFAPNPTRKCLWCPFSKAKGGPCEY